MRGGSQSFDRAAAFYDRTRITDPAQLEAAIDLLDRTLPAGSALEIGVGTGALAVPLADRGRRVVGVDLSASMLERLRSKDPYRTVSVTIADATRLPFPDGRIASAYCRWVLHLIPDWCVAVAELCRVVSRPSVVIIEPGGYSGEWRDVYLRFVQELGTAAEPVGLDLRDAYTDLDDAFTAHGGMLRGIESTPGWVDSSIETFFREAGERSYSWTWQVPEDALEAAIGRVRAWAIDRYGPDLDQPFAPEPPHRWRVYDLT
jgi:ubiquinone/menaquinone biosynthesis C-methylase UbiE